MTSEELYPMVEIDPTLSLEERLRLVRQRCRMLADLFLLQADAAFVACRVEMSCDAFAALETLCRSMAEEIEDLVHDMPGSIANWRPAPPEHAVYERQAESN